MNNLAKLRKAYHYYNLLQEEILSRSANFVASNGVRYSLCAHYHYSNPTVSLFEVGAKEEGFVFRIKDNRGIEAEVPYPDAKLMQECKVFIHDWLSLGSVSSQTREEELASKGLELINKNKEASKMNIYISFGGGHTHTINGTLFDHNCLALVKCDSHTQAREIAFEAFGNKFFTSYDKLPEGADVYFPRGVFVLNPGDSE